MSNLLFVYGTLRKGSDHINAARLSREAEYIGQGTVSATLYCVTWHPAMVTAGSHRVIGDVFRLHDLTSLDWLDAFEGCSPTDPAPHQYRRETIAVDMAHGVITAMTYVWNWDVAGLVGIESGDWFDRDPR